MQTEVIPVSFFPTESTRAMWDFIKGGPTECQLTKEMDSERIWTLSRRETKCCQLTREERMVIKNSTHSVLICLEISKS